MKAILSILSLLSIVSLHGDCNNSQSFNDEDLTVCYYHVLCELHETEEMYQILDDSTDKVKEKFWVAMNEIFAIPGEHPREDFELYKVTVCNYTEEGKKAAFNEYGSLGMEYGLAACTNPFSKLCKDFDDFLKRATAYLKKIKASDECKWQRSKFS